MWWYLPKTRKDYLKDIKENLNENIYDNTKDIKLLFDEEDISAYVKKEDK